MNEGFCIKHLKRSSKSLYQEKSLYSLLHHKCSGLYSGNMLVTKIGCIKKTSSSQFKISEIDFKKKEKKEKSEKVVAWRIARVYKVHAVLFWRELRLISGSVSVHWHSCQQIWRAPCGRSRDIRLHARTQKLTQPDAQKEKTNASLFPRRPSQPPAGSWRAEPCLSEPGAGWSDAFHPSSAVRCFPFRINWLTNGSQTCAPLQQRWPRGRRGK